MKLVGFGDSFTAGYIENTKYMSTENGHLISYISKLCEINHSPFSHWENFAKGGNSNHHIAWDVYNYIQINKKKLSNIFVFISWTSYERFPPLNKKFTDISKEENPYDFFGGDANYYPLSKKYLISQSDLKILGCCELLRQYKIPFSMINSFSNHNLHEFSAIGDIPEWINGKSKNNTLLDIINESYLDHSIIENTGDLPSLSDKIKPTKFISRCLHPTEEGHLLIANKLLNYLPKLKITLTPS